MHHLVVSCVIRLLRTDTTCSTFARNTTKISSTGNGNGKGKRKRQRKTDDNKRQKSHVHGAVKGDRTIDGNNDGNETEDEVEDAW